MYFSTVYLVSLFCRLKSKCCQEWEAGWERVREGGGLLLGWSPPEVQYSSTRLLSYLNGLWMADKYSPIVIGSLRMMIKITAQGTIVCSDVCNSSISISISIRSFSHLLICASAHLLIWTSASPERKLRNRIQNFFRGQIQNFFDTKSETFFDTKIFCNQIRYFCRQCPLIVY